MTMVVYVAAKKLVNVHIGGGEKVVIGKYEVRVYSWKYRVVGQIWRTGLATILLGFYA